MIGPCTMRNVSKEGSDDLIPILLGVGRSRTKTGTVLIRVLFRKLSIPKLMSFML